MTQVPQYDSSNHIHIPGEWIESTEFKINQFIFSGLDGVNIDRVKLDGPVGRFEKPEAAAKRQTKQARRLTLVSAQLFRDTPQLNEKSQP